MHDRAPFIGGNYFMEERMRIISRKMAVRMGLLMSFCLALTGTVTSGHFTVPGFLISFVLSLLISLVIGFIVPVGRISGAFSAGLGLERGSLGARIAESFISDLIYTPVITLAMTFFAYRMAMRASDGMADNPYVPMFLSSLVICFVVGFVLIFIFQPLFLKMLMKDN